MVRVVALSPDAVLMTDGARIYRKIGKKFADHQAVNHSAGEYVRGDAHTNTIEGVFSVFKRGMTGFRYNNCASLGVNDAQRTGNALKANEGKRLTYRRPDKAPSHLM